MDEVHAQLEKNAESLRLLFLYYKGSPREEAVKMRADRAQEAVSRYALARAAGARFPKLADESGERALAAAKEVSEILAELVTELGLE